MGIQLDGINNEIKSQTKIDFPGSVGVAGTLTYEDVTNVDSIGIVTARTGVIVGSGVTLNATGIIATGIITATTFKGDGSQLTGISADVVDDTSPQLGGDLQSNGHDIKIADASGYDGNNIYMGSDNDMRIHHDGSNFEMSNSTGTIYLRTDSAVHIQKRDGTTKIAEFNADADVELYHNGTKVCDTSTTGILMANGKGIDFANTSGSASGSTSSVLDDYEEGSWTPAYSRPNMTLTHGNQYGWYTKVGRVVHVVGWLNTTAENGSSSGGPILVTGLPFTVRETRCALSVRPSSWSNDHPSFASFEKDQTFFELLEEVEGNPSGSGDLGGGRFAGGNGNYLWFGGTYLTNS